MVALQADTIGFSPCGAKLLNRPASNLKRDLIPWLFWMLGSYGNTATKAPTMVLL
jgi:hypothetical protein